MKWQCLQLVKGVGKVLVMKLVDNSWQFMRDPSPVLPEGVCNSDCLEDVVSAMVADGWKVAPDDYSTCHDPVLMRPLAA